MATRGRARPAPVTTAEQPIAPGDSRGLWIRNRAEYLVRNQYFQYELAQGILSEPEIRDFSLTNYSSLISNMERHARAMIELHDDEPGFKEALDRAVAEKNYGFDFDTWDSQFASKLSSFQDQEVVFFRNRTTAFTLQKPCPNCGQKKLIAEGAVFTRAADEAASQFATCKNCSSRFRLQSVL